jgi:hypothetical protein
MGRIRAYDRQDYAQVLELHQRTLLKGAPPDPVFMDYLKAFYGEMLFEHPWMDDELPSLVYEQDDGAVISFVGVVPRPMTFHGRSIRTAVSVRFMADSNNRHGALAAAALHRRFLRGPQELSLVENANSAARRVWEGTPGTVVVPLGSISWTANAASLHPSPEWLGRGHDIDTPELLDYITKACHGRALQPVYDLQTLQWLVDYLDTARYRGALKRRAVIDNAGTARGWYLYYANADGYNGVLALRALMGDASAIFCSLLAHAAAGGAPVTTGRLQPELMSTLADHGCDLTFGPWMLAHSSDPRITRALVSGDAFVTRLEGEFC